MMNEAIEKRDANGLCEALFSRSDHEKNTNDAVWGDIVLFLEETLAIAKCNYGKAVAAAVETPVEENYVATLTKVQSIVPKAKLDIIIGEKNFTMKGKDYVITTPYTNIDTVLKLPRNVRYHGLYNRH
jgi:hypothetical protein